MELFANAKEGDAVALVAIMTGIHKIETVQRVTKTTIVTASGKWNRETGESLGKSSLRIEPA